MPVPVFSGIIENGGVTLEDKKMFKHYLRSFKENQKIQLIIRKYKTIRSIKQNAFYWAVVVPIVAEWAEDDPQAIHEALRHKFLEIRNSKGLKMVQSTTKLSTTEFEVYLDRIRVWLSGEGITVPAPNEAE